MICRKSIISSLSFSHRQGINMKLSLPTLISLSLALAVSGCEKNSHVAGPDSMHETPNVETQDSVQNSVVNHDSNHDSISNNTTSESGNGYSVNSVSDNSASDSNNNYVTSNSGDGYSMNFDEYSEIKSQKSAI